MLVLDITLALFILLEVANVLALYYNPTLKQANAMGVFNAWERSKKDAETHHLVRYLTYWVAGSKLIFLSLLIVILFTAAPTLKILAVGTLVLSISAFYYKMYPLIKQMDARHELSPSGYAKTLGTMIAVFMFALSISALYAYITL